MKKSIKPLALLMISGLFILSSCKKESTPEPAAPADETPTLEVGYTWTYVETKYNTDGSVDEIDTTIEAITGTSVINGSTWYSHSGGGSVQFKTDGFWVYFSGKESIRYKFPSAIGDSYIVSYIPGKTDTAVVVSTSESITVPDGIHACYRYKERDNTDNVGEYEEYFFKPNVGVIRNDEYGVINDGSGTFYLKERKVLVSHTTN